MPLLPIGSKDAVPEEGPPQRVPLGSMAEAGELGGEYGLDLLRISREESAFLARHAELGKVLLPVSGEVVELFGEPGRKSVLELIPADVVVPSRRLWGMLC